MKTAADKTVLVTGAAMGLGKLFATRAVAEKAKAVVLWDINEEALKATAAELEAAGGNVSTYVVDVSSQDSIAEAAKRSASVPVRLLEMVTVAPLWPW